MNVADTLSRAYLSDGPTDDEISKDMAKMVHSLVESLPTSQGKLAEMKLATASDETLQSLSTTVKDGWPSLKANVPTSIVHYWNVRDEIHEAETSFVVSMKATLAWRNVSQEPEQLCICPGCQLILKTWSQSVRYV